MVEVAAAFAGGWGGIPTYGGAQARVHTADGEGADGVKDEADPKNVTPLAAGEVAIDVSTRRWHE